MAGLFAGLAPTLELWAAFFCVGIFFYLFSRDARRALLVFIPVSLPFLALHFWLTWVSSGSWLPFYYRKEYYLFENAYWFHPVGIDAVREAKPVYFFHMLLGHHGLLSMTPVLIFGVTALVRSLRPGQARRAEAWAVAVPWLLLILALGWRTRNYGGVCVGFRWFLFAAPLLFAFAAVWLAGARRPAWRALFACCCLVGLVNVWDSLGPPYGAWKHSRWHEWFMRAGYGSVPEEQAGDAGS
jgi:hypothetical protein